MSAERQELETELRDAIAALRANADELGSWKEADGLAREQFTKLNARIDEIQDSLRDVEGRALRSTAGSDDEPAEDKHAIEKAALLKYLRKGEQRMSGAEFAALEGMQKTLSVDSDPDGGYVVTPEMSARIIEVVYETSPIRQIATVETIGTDTLEGTFDGDEAGAGWVSERGTRSETDTPELGQWRIPVHEMYAAPRATQKLLDDANMNVEAWLNRKVADRFARLENTAFVAGTGVGQPRGFTTYGDGTTRGTIEQIPSLDANYLEPEAVINIMYALKNAYRTGSVWVMNRSVVGYIRTLRTHDSEGDFLWQAGYGTQPPTILGYPIVEAEDMDDLGTGTNLPIAFGNFRDAYTIVDRVGIRVLRDPYSNKPYVEFYTTKRTGGDVVNFEAIKLMDVAAS